MNDCWILLDDEQMAQGLPGTDGRQQNRNEHIESIRRRTRQHSDGRLPCPVMHSVMKWPSACHTSILWNYILHYILLPTRTGTNNAQHVPNGMSPRVSVFHNRCRRKKETDVRGTKGVPRKVVRASVSVRVWTCKEFRVKLNQTSCYLRPPLLGTPLVPSRTSLTNT